jgi:MFS family permease
MAQLKVSEPAKVAAPDLPRRRGLVVAISVLAGFVLTMIWSAPFVDRVIGNNVASTLLGHEPETPIAGTLAGIAFAFVSGLAGTFTACNIAAFGAVAPMIGQEQSTRDRLLRAFQPLAWLAAGMVVVSALYGALVGLAGTSMPQFSQNSVQTGLVARNIQSMVVFGLIGLALVYLGLAALRLVPDPFARISERFPHARLFVVGALIGGFLVGRPFPLFRQLFRYAAESGNPLFGAGAFVLQSLGNIALMAIVFAVLMSRVGAPLRRWLAAKPYRIALLTAVGFIVAGAFTFLYWDVRLLSFRGFFWYPTAPWT